LLFTEGIRAKASGRPISERITSIHFTQVEDYIRFFMMSEVPDNNTEILTTPNSAMVTRSIKRDDMRRCDPIPYITLIGDPNTKGTPRGRKRKCSLDVWVSIRRIRTIDEEDKPAYPDCERGSGKQPFTHVCLECWQPLVLTKNGDTWQTTKGIRHLKLCPKKHSQLLIPTIEQNVARSLKKEYESNKLITGSLMQQGEKLAPHSTCQLIQGKMISFVKHVSPTQQALLSQARFYAYSCAKVSKNTFQDKYFREMLREQLYAGYKAASNNSGRVPEHYPQLTKRGLLKYITQEHRILECTIKVAIRLCLEFSEGNPVAQGLHDCATLANKHKHMVVGVGSVSTGLKNNVAICLAMVPIIDGYDITGANILRDTISKYTDKSYENICHGTISDAAAGIARFFGHDQDICGMHSSDKIPRSAIGDLTCSKNKEVINPFPTGQVLHNKAHPVGVNFSYEKREIKLHQLGETVEMAPIKIQMEHNGTRARAYHMLLISLLQVNHGLKLYNQAEPSFLKAK